LHAIGRRDVVLQQDGDTVERPARSSRAHLGIQVIGNSQRIRVGLDHGVQRRARAVHGGNSIQTRLHQLMRRKFATVQRRSQLTNRNFFDHGHFLRCRTAD